MSKQVNGFDLLADIDDVTIINDDGPVTIDTTDFFNIPSLTTEEDIVTIEAEAPTKETKQVKETKDVKTETTETTETVEESELNEVVVEPVYDEYSEYAIMVLEKVRNGAWELEEKEIPKDLDAATFLELMDAQEQAFQEKFQKSVTEQAGEFASYLEFLLKGGSKEVVEDAISIKQITQLDTDTEDNQKKILTAYLELKGLEDDIIQETIESLLDKGKAEEKADQAIEELKKYEQTILETKTKEMEEYRKKQELAHKTYVESITNLVKKGKVNGVDIDKRKQDQILNTLFKPTEVIEYTDPNTGEVRKGRITKAKALFNEMNSNPEKLIAMTMWLMEGGNFEAIKEEIKEKKDDQLRKILEGRKSATITNKQRTQNGFEVLANQANTY